jgi:nicotinamidase-related amidase
LEQHHDDNIVTKQRLGAFLGADLDDYLRQRGATQVLLTGVATSSGGKSTPCSAYDLGYNVTLVVDVMTDRDAHAHRHSVVKIFSRVGETDTTDNVLKLLRGGRGDCAAECVNA